MIVKVETFDIKNASGRIVPEKTLKKALKEYAETIVDKPAFGFVHGADNVDENGCERVERISHIIHNVEVYDEGVKAEISFPNTVWGNITERIYDVEGSFFAPRLAFDGEELKEVVSIDFCLNKVGYDERKKK